MEKTNTHYRSSVKRLLAFLLCAVCVFGMIPTQAFAFSPGQKASSWLGDQYVGSDRQHYYAPAPYTYLVYNSDGTMDVRSSSGGNAYRHYMLTASDGSSQQVYCVESGIAYNTSDNTYTSESGTNSNYLNLLPSEARRGITLTAIYGWKPGASLPVSGINEDDYKMATQIILWEYQQQLRSAPYSRHGNGHADANQYFSVIAGRPAEKAYNWILSQVASHSTIPSFTSTKKSEAPELELKWNTEKKIYTLTVTDTNNLKIDLETLKGSGVSVTRSGNKYTFTSKNMIMDPVTFGFRKDIPVANDMLIWGRPGYQTMMTGASDPVSFFVKIKTETYGTAKIVKTSEDGIVSGIPFQISGTDILGNKVDETVTTGENGQIKEKLLPGTYLVKELPVYRYVTPSAQYVTIESGQNSTVHFSNILKKFRVHVVKSDADTGTAQGDATLAGATYGIYNNGELVDTYTTGPDASFMTRYYVCGDNWTVREIDPSTGYLLNDTVYEVGASPTLYEVELNTTENQVTETVIYGNIQLVKHTDDLDPDVSGDENTDEPNEGVIERPEAGAVFEVYLKAVGSYDAAKESERDLLTTDGDGFASSKMLPYGHYTIHQVSGEEGKAFIPDFTVFISSNGRTYSYILNNRTITARLRVEKCDAETGNIIPMTGTGFQIKDLSTGEFVTQDIYYPNPETLDTFYVSDEGWLMLPEPLHTGDYELYEVAAPYGYALSSEPVPFTIDGSEAVVTVTQYNMPQKGQLTITKTGEVFASVQENDGLYQPVYEVMGLRVGIYTVTEISNRASRDYIIPDAATVEIKADETTTVQFFNEKPEKPKTPDNPDNPKTPSNPSTPSNPDKAVPQTGDDNFIFLYGGLLALAVIGGGLFAAAYFKKGKYSRNTPKRKAVGIAAVSLCGLLALGSGFLMVRDLNQYSESAGAYEDIASHVELPEQTEAPEDDNTETEPTGEYPSVVLPTVDFDALRETGPDIIGWLTLPDTAINYPVTLTDDNEYYLHHLYDGTYNKTGCLFADYENQEDFSDRNTIIYGHNMRDGSMFAALNEYDEQSYFDGHPQMYLVTPGGGYVVEIFTAFVAKPSESGSGTSPWRLSFKDDGAYTTWLSEMAGRSVIETDVTATSSDKVLTLSTCTPGGASRFIVMGKLAAVND